MTTTEERGALGTHPFSRPPRRDAAALAFGVAFIVFGALGLLRAAGLRIESVWLYPILLIGLGAAGLAGALLRPRR